MPVSYSALAVLVNEYQSLKFMGYINDILYNDTRSDAVKYTVQYTVTVIDVKP